MRALSLLASFLALWAGTAMLLSRLPWFRDSVSLAERLAPYAPNIRGSTRLSVGDGLALERLGESSARRHSGEGAAADSSRSSGSRGRRA